MSRPEGWVNDYTMEEGYLEFEAGADAYEAALKKRGHRVDIRDFGETNCYFPFLLTIPAKGYLVFIPEEVE